MFFTKSEISFWIFGWIFKLFHSCELKYYESLFLSFQRQVETNQHPWLNTKRNLQNIINNMDNQLKQVNLKNRIVFLKRRNGMRQKRWAFQNILIIFVNRSYCSIGFYNALWDNLAMIKIDLKGFWIHHFQQLLTKRVTLVT